MKKRKLKTKYKRKKNPINLNKEQILNHLRKNDKVFDLMFLDEGVESEVYKFIVIDNTHVFDQLIKKGIYVIKIYKVKKHYVLDKIKQDYLMLLSKYGLIPKIYYIDSNIIIMQFIKGIPLKDFINDSRMDSKTTELLKSKYLQLLQVWKKLGFEHDDLGFRRTRNVLVSRNYNSYKLYIIDPYLGWREQARRP